MKTYKLFHLIFAYVLVFSFLGMPASVLAEEAVLGPSVDIAVYNNSAYASNWPPGAEVTIFFDIPGNGIEWDYSETAIAPVWDGGGWCQFIFNIDPADFRIAAGQTVRITDGATTRQATIPDVQVTAEDPTADTIRGTAPAGSTVDVAAIFWSGGSGNFRRHAIADNSGNWLADFAHTAAGVDEQTTFDVIPGTGFFWVSQPISDFIGVKFMWDFGPYFHVFPEDGRIETYVWPFGANLALAIDDPATTDENPDLTRTQENLGWQTNFEDLGTIKPGFTVSITDGLVTKTHTVTDLALTGVDSPTDRVTGTAIPGSVLELRICCGDHGWVNRHASAGENRVWFADFSVPGEGGNEQDLFDIRPGEEGEVQQSDTDGDATVLRWRGPNPPAFTALPDEDSIEGNDWPLASTLTVEIDVPDGPDYTTNTLVNPADQDHNQTWFKLDLAGVFDLPPGQIVTVFDATTTKQTTVTHSTITVIDPGTDTITGNAGPNIVNVVLWACDDDGCGARYKDVDPAGNWSVNFAISGEQGWEDGIVDIQPNTTGGIYQGDADGDGTTYQRWQVVTSQPPVITALRAPVAPVQLGQSIDATATFSDPDPGDTHTVKWTWGDGATIEVPAAVPSVTTSNTYASPGVYTVTATITDAQGGSDTETYEFVVVYDPDGGFVTGGGWITSPIGAYTLDPSLTGKATFGFVSKYQRGANVPAGDTEFQFKVANLNFKSTSYQWLVVAATRAQFKGLGTINGAGEYGFLLSAIDGQLNGGGGVDRFRIKIWDKATGQVVYDNMLGVGEGADPTTYLGGGSIVIHR
jgi:hypothetical protein